MTASAANSVTTLLQAWHAGDDEALEKLTPLVYRELHRAARNYMAHEASGHLLGSTALINEVYLRLLKHKRTEWKNRSHFLAGCAQLMRHVLTDYARSRLYQKRGGNQAELPLEEARAASDADTQIVELDHALQSLAAHDPRKSRVIELRVFVGLSVKETADALSISEDTVQRDTVFAKHWLLRELRSSASHGR